MKKRTLVLVVSICILIAVVIGISSIKQKSSAKERSTVLKVDNVSAKRDTDISVDVNLNNLNKNVISGCNFNLNYDKDILDVSKVLSGSIMRNSKENFDYDVDKNNGKIKFLYADGTKGKESIIQDGKFAKVIFKIKNKSKKGKTQINFTGDKKFYNKDLKKVNVQLENGSIEIK